MKRTESDKKETRIMDSFINSGWILILLFLLVPALAWSQGNLQNRQERQDTATKTKLSKDRKVTRSDTSRTYQYQQQNQKGTDVNRDYNRDYNNNQNQKNQNRYEKRGDTLQNGSSKDAILIENNPRK